MEETPPGAWLRAHSACEMGRLSLDPDFTIETPWGIRNTKSESSYKYRVKHQITDFQNLKEELEILRQKSMPMIQEFCTDEKCKGVGKGKKVAMVALYETCVEEEQLLVPEVTATAIKPEKRQNDDHEKKRHNTKKISDLFRCCRGSKSKRFSRGFIKSFSNLNIDKPPG